MGERGFPAAPTSLKLLKGEKRSRINLNEPKPDSPSPPKPQKWLSPDAKSIWWALAPEMHAKEVLTDWDREAFAVFCEAVVHHRQACELVNTSASLVRGAQGNLVKNPALQIARDQAQIIRAYAHEFGLTPASRSGLELPTTQDFDDARRLLS